jgi:hypothetical protein
MRKTTGADDAATTLASLTVMAYTIPLPLIQNDSIPRDFVLKRALPLSASDFNHEIPFLHYNRY